MTSRTQMEQIIRSLWVARLKEDVNQTLKDFAEDGVFGLNAQALDASLETIKGKPAVKATLQNFFNLWQLDDWKEVDLFIDGEKAMLHWRARATFTGTKKSALFDVYDVITFRDGKIVEYRQSTDTAKMMSLAA